VIGGSHPGRDDGLSRTRRRGLLILLALFASYVAARLW